MHGNGVYCIILIIKVKKKNIKKTGCKDQTTVVVGAII